MTVIALMLLVGDVKAQMVTMAVHVNDLLTTALGVVSIATLAGLGLLRGTVTNLRENLKDAREEIADKDRRLVDAEAKIGTQAADLQALTRVVTGEAHWETLSEKLDDHHRLAMDNLTELREEIRKLRDTA